MVQKKSLWRGLKRWGWLGFVVLWIGCGQSGPVPGSNTTVEPFQAPQSASLTTAPQTTAEEADLYKVRGHLLFYLHKYRGLTIFDLQDPKKPKRLASVPVFGDPVEMFVDQTTAYVLVAKPLVARRDGTKRAFQAQEIDAQLVTIDIREPAKAKLLARIELTGELRRGDARKLDNIIYVLSHQPKQNGATWHVDGLNSQKITTLGNAWLWSIDVSSPEKLRISRKHKVGNTSPAKVVDKQWPDHSDIEFRQVSGAQFRGFVMTTVAGRLLLTERWLINADFTTHRQEITTFRDARGCGPMTESQQVREIPVNFQLKLYYSVINVFRIDNQDGAFHNARFAIAGVIGDQFKQSIQIHKDSGELVYFGITQRNRVVINPSRITTEIKNVMVSVSLATGAPALLSSLDFGKPGETVRGSYFDHSRQVAYAITATGIEPNAAPTNNPDVDRSPTTHREVLRSYDPLYAIDLSEPKKLKSLSDIDGLNGDVNLFRPLQGGKFLLAVGRDTSPSCTGFDQGTGYSRTAVSLIDVRDLTNIKLVQRRCVALHPDANITSSEVNWDRDQAHKLIGFYSDQDTSVVAVPVSYSFYNATSRKTESGVAIGLMGWDLSQYQPGKPAEQQQVLQELGTVTHHDRALQRTLLMKLPQGGAPQLALVNLFDETMLLTGLQDPNAPTRLSEVEIAPYIDAIYRFGEYLVELVIPRHNINVSGHLGASNIRHTLRIRKWAPDAPHQQPVEKTIGIGDVAQSFKWGDYLLLYRRSSGSGSRFELWDMRDPAAAKAISWLTLPFATAMPLLKHIDGSDQSPDHEWLLTKQGLLFTTQSINEGKAVVLLHRLDLSTPKKLSIETLKEYSLQGKKSAPRLISIADDALVLDLASQDADGVTHFRCVRWRRHEEQWKELVDRKAPGLTLHAFAQEGTMYFVMGLGSDVETFHQLALLSTETHDGPFQIIDTLAWSSARPSDVLFAEGSASIRTSTGIHRYTLDTKGFQLQATHSINTTGMRFVSKLPGALLMQLDQGGLFLLPDKQGLETSELKPFIPIYQWHDTSSSGTQQAAKRLFPQARYFLRGEQKLWIAAGQFGILAFDLSQATGAP